MDGLVQVLTGLIIPLIFVLLLISAAVKVVQEYERGVIFRLGRLVGAKGPGLFFIIPVVDRMVKVDLRVVVLDIPSQDCITNDNVTVKVNAVAYYRVIDPELAVVAIEDYRRATWQLAQTSLRNVIGQSQLDELLAHREKINEELATIIDEQTEPWGVKVSIVEVKDVELPQSMQRAMARQAEAEREKRERFYKEMSEQQKVEFINGEIVMQSPAKLRHTIASKNLLMLLDVYVQKHGLGFVGHEKMLITLTRTDYEPDICYFGPEKARTFTPDQIKFPSPDFVVEVLSPHSGVGPYGTAPTTEANDLGVKFVDYAAHGVAEYWLVDPDAEMIEQYLLEGEAYQLHVKTDTGTVRSVAVAGFAVPVRAVFDEAAKLAAVQAILDADA